MGARLHRLEFLDYIVAGRIASPDATRHRVDMRHGIPETMSEAKHATTDIEEVESAYSWLATALGGKFGALLVALMVLLLYSPLAAEGWLWDLGMAVMVSGVLIAAMEAASPGPRAFRIGVALAIIDFLSGRVVAHFGVRWLVVAQAMLWIATLVYVIVAILNRVFTQRNVAVSTLQAALCVYLMIGMLWVYLYMLVSLVHPNSFRVQGVLHERWTDEASRRAELLKLIVFSYSTLTSSGLGDLTTATPFASICANIEALTGQVYLAVVIARLVGLQSTPPPRPRKKRDELSPLHSPSGEAIGQAEP